MAEKIVSPGVFSNEIDASFLPAAIGDIGAAVVGPTVKGPALLPTVVSSYSEFQAIFGDTFKSGSTTLQYLTSHTAQEYLKHAGKLTVVRILDGTPLRANATVLTAGSTSPTGLTYGVGGLAILGTEESATYVISSSTVSSTQFIGQASPNTDSSTDDIRFFFKGTDATALATNLAAEFNATSKFSDFSAAGVGAEFQISGAAAGIGGNGLSVTSGSSTFSTAGGTDDAAVETTAFKINALNEGTVLNNAANYGTNGLLQSGSASNVRWEISTNNATKGTFTLLVRKGDDINKRKQILETWNNLSMDPNASNYVGKAVGDSYPTITANGDDPFVSWAGKYPNKSKYVYVSEIGDLPDFLDEQGDVRVVGSGDLIPAVGTGSAHGSFSGGTNGFSGFDSLGNHVTSSTLAGVVSPVGFYDGIVAGDSQGFKISSTTAADGGAAYMTALNLLKNADEYDINLILLPGIVDSLATGHTGLITKAIDVCESRGDCFFVYDSVAYSETSIANVTTKVETRDSNYAATYWPWVQISDAQTGTLRWVPPSVVLPGIYAFNDKVAAPWFAPAGLNRGGLTTVVQAARKLTHTNRDDLYESNVNPIATFPGQGVVVWGQKTIQKKASALDRVNVRRLLIKVKKFIAASSRFLLFEQNNAVTRNKFLNIANPYLEQVQAQSGLNAFKVIMDDTNNTPDIVDRNILYGQIFLQPTRTAEFIVLDFTIQPTGATFPE